jgi:hypothetical membrane protein
MADPDLSFASPRRSPEESTLRLLSCGALAPLVFWATTILCASVLGNYNHLSRMVSELGAVGTRSRLLFTAGLLSCSILSALFVFGLIGACRHAKLSTVPAWLILSHSVSIAGAGLFPLPLRLHGILGMPSVFLVLSPLLALVLWPGTRSPSKLKVAAGLALALMSLGFLAFSPTILGALPGLKQRLFHLGWGIWFLALSLGFSRALKTAPREPGSAHA